MGRKESNQTNKRILTLVIDVKRTLSKRLKTRFQDQLSPNAGQKYCRMLQGEHSSILWTFIKLTFVIKILDLSFFEHPLKTDFTITKKTYTCDIKLHAHAYLHTGSLFFYHIPTLAIDSYTLTQRGSIAQSVTCLARDANLTADPGVGSLIRAWSNTFLEIDHQIISRSFSSLLLNHS